MFTHLHTEGKRKTLLSFLAAINTEIYFLFEICLVDTNVLYSPYGTLLQATPLGTTSHLPIFSSFLSVQIAPQTNCTPNLLPSVLTLNSSSGGGDGNYCRWSRFGGSSNYAWPPLYHLLCFICCLLLLRINKLVIPVPAISATSKKEREQGKQWGLSLSKCNLSPKSIALFSGPTRFHYRLAIKLKLFGRKFPKLLLLPLISAMSGSSPLNI